MDTPNKRKKIVIIAVALIVLFIATITILIVRNNNPSTDITIQTSEEYKGPPSTGLYGDAFEEFYSNITDKDFNYLKYALGDFIYNNRKVDNLLTRAKITSVNQEYKNKQDIVYFTFIIDGDNTTYNAMIVRSMNDSFENRLVISDYAFDVVLSNYVFMY